MSVGIKTAGLIESSEQIGGTRSRGSFATNMGFIMAAAGSAVGLGNIWKFPYITGVYGGGAFVLVYLLCIAAVGLPLMYAELIIGRRGGKDILGAMRSLLAKAGMFGRIISFATGAMGILAGFLILSFYSVVAGWALHFLLISLGLIPGAALGSEGSFGALVSSPATSSLWHTVFMLMTIVVVAASIHGGIERLCKRLMPALVAMLIGLLGYVAVTGGLGQSMTFLFQPDFSKLTPEAVLEALGHAFFTLSLGMGAMVTYGSYLKSEKHVLRDGVAVAFLDTVIALLAGIVIFAVVFSAGQAAGSGPGLLFNTLPGLFAGMPGGIVVATVFFLLVVFAAWSSAVSLLEVVVAYLVDERGWNRRSASISVGVVIWALGLASAITLTSETSSLAAMKDGIVAAAASGDSMGEKAALAVGHLADNPPNVLDILDNLTTRYMLPLGGLLIALAAGWMISREDRESGFAHLGPSGRLMAKTFTLMIRFVTPALVLVVILWKLGVLQMIGLI